MKRVVKQGMILVFTVLFALGMAALTLAEERTEMLMELERPDNIMVVLFYDREEPAVRFLSPSGQEYAEDLGNLSVERSQGALYCYLPAAEAGIWMIRYDTRNNTEVQIDYNPYTEPIEISAFTVKKDSPEQVTAEFQADFPREITYQYSLSAVLTDESGAVTGSRELVTGTGISGQPVKRDVSLSNLGAYDKYGLELNVWYKEYSLETWDTRVASETFEARGGNEAEPLKGMDIQVDMTNREILIDWEKYRVSCDHYLIAVKREDDDPKEPYFFQEVKEALAVKAGLPKDCDSILVELTCFGNDGRASLPCSRRIRLDAVKCSLVTDENTGAAQAEISYETKGRIQAEVYVNEEVQSLQLEGTGSFSVDLEEFQNEIRMSCRTDEMTELVYEWSVYSDRIAPYLKLYEDIEGLVVDRDSFLLMGEIDSGCSLTINGEAVEAAKDGVFKKELKLKKGENPVEIEAMDPSGNKSRLSAVIFRGSPGAAQAQGTDKNGPASWLGERTLLFFTILIGIAETLTAILTVMVMERRSQKNGGLALGTMTITVLRNLFLTAVLSACLAAAWFAASELQLQRTADSAQFLNIAKNSADNAYALLEKMERCRRLKVAALAGAAIFAAWGVFLGVLKKIVDKRAKNI